MGHELARHDVQVRLDSKGDIPSVCGGHVAMQQVIMNLLLNAERALVDADSTNREIRVRLREKNGGAEVMVRDFGPGIDKEIADRIFEPFVTTKQGNLGMGLAVCRRIVENQGGQLTLEHPEGGGARFRIWLPACRL
jgi:C4-dicarboxylate-specific signal transduction histidine kinase